MALFHGARPANLGLFPISNQAGKSIKSSFVLAMRHLFPFLFEKKTQKHPANNRFKADKNNIEITEEEMSKKHTHTHKKKMQNLLSTSLQETHTVLRANAAKVGMRLGFTTMFCEDQQGTHGWSQLPHEASLIYLTSWWFFPTSFEKYDRQIGSSSQGSGYK